jgi:hypothetical protein
MPRCAGTNRRCHNHDSYTSTAQFCLVDEDDGTTQYGPEKNRACGNEYENTTI